MAIRFIKSSKRFVIDTKNTTYAFEIFKRHYLVHLYYGKKKARFEEAERRSLGFSPNVAEYSSKYSPDNLPLEVSFFGSGDYRDTSVCIVGKDGTGVTDFKYKSYRIFEGRQSIDGLPFARPDADSETLEILMQDKVTGCELYLYYTVFPESDVISRHMALVNNGKSSVKLARCMPMELNLDRSDLDMITLWGRHNGECNYQRVQTHHGVQSVGSRRGASSHQYNPFMALCAHTATEERGDAYGFNFVYSGSFLDEVELDQTGRTKALMGMDPATFGYILDAGERFESPEAVMTYSHKGLGQMSRNFHKFVKNNIMPKKALDPHPVVLNTWEACYFDIDEKKLLQFAEKGAAMGFDMLVMDDGWFAERHHDRAALGDWYANKDKFPNGLADFVKNVRSKGIKFGIWIEPEMVNPDSDLYRAHPDWALRASGREPLVSRKQLVLDMSRDEVIDYLIGAFDKVFDGVEIDYFKWDMNRHMCNVGSAALPPERQCEVYFRYIKGVYRLMDWFVKRFPNAVIETCSGGGGRYDLGMMPYGIQIWTSDNTNPYNRTFIQSGAMLAYPATTMSCHVSNPKENMKSLDYRYKVACEGMLGYELNILEMSDEVNAEISRQIAEYRKFEHVMRLGEFYRLASPENTKYSAYYYTTDDASEIVLTVVEKEDCRAGSTKLLKIKAALPDATYTDLYSGKRYAGRELIEGLYIPLMGEPDSARLIYLKKD
ncbi:MAG: alpha-galactosidase [Clostridia bacterium]|nr:alpha-galactosidase [Clostridia bacterium]